ncbi:hypothetical protein MRB53_024109 [Persea americana]|uniref:Uncharacterized protein n=1 Tax=Persea americana TaxID=3435 RepID=A0ACC2LC53_PERAE|nr:hypothetical protein MRB53_024109 [Persea americana]
MVAPISCSHWSQKKTNPTPFADEMPSNPSLMNAYGAPSCIPTHLVWFALPVSIPRFSSSNKLHLKKAFEAFWITFAWWPNVQKIDGYGSHPLQRPLPPIPANGHCSHHLSPLLLLPHLCKLSARPATASSPPSAPGHCDLLQIRGHFQTTGHPQTSGHSPYNLHNLLTSRPVHLNPYSAAIVALFPRATTAAGHPTCKHPAANSHLHSPLHSVLPANSSSTAATSSSPSPSCHPSALAFTAPLCTT